MAASFSRGRGYPISTTSGDTTREGVRATEIIHEVEFPRRQGLADAGALVENSWTEGS
jgi:hypothetical protein